MDASASTEGQSRIEHLRILVVGDATGAADGLARALDDAGATVSRVTSRDQALVDLAQRDHDVVLAQYDGPSEANAAFVERIRSLDHGDLATALAAFCESGQCDDALDDGFDGVVTLPFERANLLTSVRSAVERAALRRAGDGASGAAVSVDAAGDVIRAFPAVPNVPAAAGTSELGLQRGGNLLLGSLSDAAFERLAVHLSPARLVAGTVLVESGEPAGSLFFLSEGLASRVLYTDKRASADVGLVGREGFVDLESLLGGGSPFATIVRIEAKGWRLPFEAGVEALRNEPEVRDAVHRYAAVRETEATMNSLCARAHSAESRIARWLLVVRAATGTDRFPLTQETLASIVGLRRAGITVAARALKTSGIIDYSWGQIRIADVHALEERACECHHLLKAHKSR